jgi:hypothetical protein
MGELEQPTRVVLLPSRAPAPPPLPTAATAPPPPPLPLHTTTPWSSPGRRSIPLLPSFLGSIRMRRRGPTPFPRCRPPPSHSLRHRPCLGHPGPDLGRRTRRPRNAPTGGVEDGALTWRPTEAAPDHPRALSSARNARHHPSDGARPSPRPPRPPPSGPGPLRAWVTGPSNLLPAA